MILPLRRYQREVVEQAQDALHSGVSPCVAMATGSGKSWCIAELAALELLSGFSHVAVICRSVDILKQLESLFSTKLGKRCGWFAGSARMDLLAPIQLVSSSTLAMRAKQPRYQLFYKLLWGRTTRILVDEAHTSVSGQVEELLAEAEAQVCGFTATPWSKVCLNFDILIAGPLPAELLAMGHLVPLRGVSPELVAADGIGKVAGEYRSSEVSAIMRDPFFTKRMVREVRRYVPTGKVIYFCADQLHAQVVHDAERETGYRSELITCDSEGRLDGIAALRVPGATVSGATRDILGTGIDITDLKAVVLLRHTASAIVHYQQTGRVWRPDPGSKKEFGWVFDYVGNSERHGWPELLEEYSFAGSRAKGTREIGTKVCDLCGAENGAMRLVCVSCQAPFEEVCPVCRKPMYFTQLVCRGCGYDRRNAEELRKAQQLALERLSALRACFEKYFLDSEDRFRYDYARVVHESWRNGTPLKPLGWLRGLLKQGVQLAAVQPYTAYTLWSAEMVAADPVTYYAAYAEHLGARIAPVDALDLMGLQFGAEGRRWYYENKTQAAKLWSRSLPIRRRGF